jgi:hypothetical protein
MPSRHLLAPVLLAVLGFATREIAAQEEPSNPPGTVVQALVVLGGAEEERLRDAPLRDGRPVDGFLLRSPSSLTPRSGATLRILLPQGHLTHNSRIPHSFNGGGAGGGRGAAALGTAGIVLEAGPVRWIVSPEVVMVENRSFASLLPPEWEDGERETLKPPWQVGAHSIDLPLTARAGSWSSIRPGQSSVTVHAGALALGAATENQWWGPAVRNALVMSSNAEGIPHLFVRTDRPLTTPIGRLEGRWMVGALESTRGRADGARSLSAAALTLSPAPGLAVGFARAVYAPRPRRRDAVRGAADVFHRWRGAGDTLAAGPFEQITSVFGRWVLPAEGAEIYLEWARHRLPSSPRDLLVMPEHSQGYVIGGRWLLGRIRLEAEHAYLEKSPTYRTRDVGSFYASAAVPDGYTHRGSVIGASIGPGASGGWLAADWLIGRGRLGVFAGRVRWANDAYYDNPASERVVVRGREQPRSRYRGHDVSVLGGLRAGVGAGPYRLDAEWTASKRYNYLFQNNSVDWFTRGDAVNVVNHTLVLRASALPPRPRNGS